MGNCKTDCPRKEDRFLKSELQKISWKLIVKWTPLKCHVVIFIQSEVRIWMFGFISRVDKAIWPEWRDSTLLIKTKHSFHSDPIPRRRSTAVSFQINPLNTCIPSWPFSRSGSQVWKGVKWNACMRSILVCSFCHSHNRRLNQEQANSTCLAWVPCRCFTVVLFNF